METKHTPGQWLINDMPDDENGNKSVMISTDRFIATVAVNDEQQQANAQLIVSAPKLLEALKWMIERLDNEGKIDHVTDEGMIEDIKNVINKVTK